MSIDSDLDAMFAHAASFGLADATVTYQGRSCSAFLDEVDEALVRAGDDPTSVLGFSRSVVVKSGALGTVEPHTDITVSGTTYRIHDVRREGDGRTTRIFLGRAR